MKLEEIKNILININTISIKDAKLLYQIIFGVDSGRLSRNRIKKFEGFKFEEEELNKKIEEVEDIFSPNELRIIANILNLDVSSNKEIGREVYTFLNNFDETLEENGEEQCEEEQSENQEEIEKGEEYEEVSQEEEFPKRAVKYSLTSRDVEDSIRPFNGEDNYPIMTWLRDFEEMAEVMQWREIEMLVFAKKSLKGLAKLFIRGERGLSSYNALKNALIEEFSRKLNSAELHEALRNRAMKKEESLHEYVLEMKEISERGTIEVDALIQYIVDGIPDPASCKAHLYEAKTLKELKEKLIVYERVRNKFNRKDTDFTLVKKNPESNVVTIKKCFNCNREGHLTIDCTKPKRERGSCFNCGKMGHQVRDCTERKQKTSSKEESAGSTYLIEEAPLPPYTATVVIDDIELQALVDTGSGISLISKNVIDEKKIEDAGDKHFEEKSCTQYDAECNSLMMINYEEVANEPDILVNPNLPLEVGFLQEEKSTLLEERRRLSEVGGVEASLRKQIETLREEVFKLETSRDDYRLKTEEQERLIVELEIRVEEAAKTAIEARQLKDELDILRETADKADKYETTLNIYKKKLEETGDLKRELKMLETKNLEYLQRNIELEEEIKRVSPIKSQLDVLKRQVSDLQEKLSEETKHVDKLQYDSKVLQDKLSAALREKQRLEVERDSLKETNEELRCAQFQVTNTIGGPELGGSVSESLISHSELAQKEKEEDSLSVVQNLLDDARAQVDKMWEENRAANRKIIQLEGELKEMSEPG